MRKISIAVSTILTFFIMSGQVFAAPATIFSTDEVTGTGVTSRADTDALNDPWEAAVISSLGVTASDFEVGGIDNATLPNVLSASNGLNVTVSLNDMTNIADTTDFGVPANTQGSAGNATSTTMQDSAPKPSSIYDTGSSAYYNEISGSGSSRNGLVFDFSQPTSNFGAWFGDVETRTDGSGTAAEVRLYDSAGIFMSSHIVEPMPSDPAFDQSQCGAPVQDNFRGCGNRSSRWIGFVADPTMLVSKMILIVGDDDTTAGTDDANTEHMSFIGATTAVVPPAPQIGVSKVVATAIDDGAGLNTVTYNVEVTNTGNVALQNVSLVDDLAITFGHPGTTTISNPSVTLLNPPADTTSSIVANASYAIGDWETITSGGTLAVGDSFTLEISVMVDIGTDVSLVGPYDNTAVATGTHGQDVDQIIVTDDSQDGLNYSPDANDDPTDNNEPTPVSLVPAPIVDPPAPGMTLVKSSVFNDEDGDGFAAVGESINYSFEVCNTGGVVLNNVSIDDSIAEVDGEIAALAIGACDTSTFVLNYVLTAEDITAGEVANTARALATFGDMELLWSVVSDSGNPLDDTGATNDPTHQVLMVADVVDEEEPETLAETGATTGVIILSGIVIMLSSVLPYVSMRKFET